MNERRMVKRTKEMKKEERNESGNGVSKYIHVQKDNVPKTP